MKRKYVKMLSFVLVALIVFKVVGITYFWMQVSTLLEVENVDVREDYGQSIPTFKYLSYDFWSTKTGKKYYPKDCLAGMSIPEVERVYFSSAFEAERYGKELAKRCQ